MMNMISITAQALGWAFEYILSLLQKFLHVNYCIVEFVIKICHSLIQVISEIILCVWDVLRCYYCDFRAFSSEFTAGVYFIAKLVFDFLSSSVSHICTFIGYLMEIANLIQLKILTATNFIVYCTSQITENLVYCIQLLFAATLLLLQLGPNLLMLFYEGLLLCCKSMVTGLKYAACSVFHHICVFQLQWFNAVLSIPAQAYVGLLMFSVLFYFYKSIKPFLQSYFILLAAFGMHLFQKMYYCIFIIFTYFSRIALKIKAIYRIFIPQRSVQDSEVFQQPSTSHAINCQPKRISAFYKYIKRKNFKLKIPFYKTEDEYMDQQLEYLKRELSAEKEKHLCVVCHDSEKNVILFPCRHMCMCESCTLALQSSFQGCPLCRRQILSVSQVYT